MEIVVGSCSEQSRSESSWVVEGRVAWTLRLSRTVSRVYFGPLLHARLTLLLPARSWLSFPHLDATSPLPEIATLSLLVQPHYLPSYTPLPDWLEEGTDASLRDSPFDTSTIPAPYTSISSGSSSSAAYLQSLSSSTLKGFGSDSLNVHSGRSSPAGSFRGGGVGAEPKGRSGFRDLEKFYESEEEEDR